MNFSNLIDSVQKKTGFRKGQVKEILEAGMASITQGLLQDGRVVIHGFGVFRRHFQEPKVVSVGFQGGKKVTTGPRMKVRFKPAPGFQGALNKIATERMEPAKHPVGDETLPADPA